MTLAYQGVLWVEHISALRLWRTPELAVRDVAAPLALPVPPPGRGGSPLRTPRWARVRRTPILRQHFHLPSLWNRQLRLLSPPGTRC